MSNEVTKCLLCGNIAELRHNEYPGYQEPDTYMIYHCPNCNTAFSLPRREASSIYENIYKNAERVPGYHRYRKYARSVRKFADPLKYLADTSEVYWGVKQALKLFSDPLKPAKILEIGSGLGYLTFSLVKNNYKATGIDISENAVNKAKETFGDHYVCANLADYALENSGLFDFVISTEVIEHFENIPGFLNSVMQLLKHGGQVIITTPNKSFFPDDIIWATDQPPVHYWWLSEESMKYIAGKLDASISFINFRDYYKKNYKIVGLRSPRNGHLPGPCFNKEGELIKSSSGSLNTLKADLQVFFSGIPVLSSIGKFFKRYLKLIFGVSRRLFEKDTLVCCERGIILCAVLQKRS
jgi:2-polyprenyl-3-methyl-5-hydroxy-6-metoxy-1,4-benzoquinol methylase